MSASRVGRLLAVVALAVAGVAGPATARAAGETPVRLPDQAVYDLAAAFDVEAERTAESLAATVRDNADADVVVVAETVAAPLDAEQGETRATQLRIALRVGDGAERGGALLYFGIEADGCATSAAMSGDSVFEAEILSADDAAAIVAMDLEPLIARCDHDSALLVGLGRIATAALNVGAPLPGSADNAGPRFRDPVDGVAVYDHAGIFAPETIAAVERQIDAIEDRTGAEIAVYTQVVEDGRSTDAADADARALMDQWGVGRKGFDDGLVILFDMYPDLRHGQVILYGGPGFRATFLDNSAKQRILEDDMLPRLRAADFDGALIVAMERVDAAATPENAAALERARQVNAVAGLVAAPLAGILLVAWALWSWLRFGRDPAYLDDPSIHMAGPPEALTPAGAVFVLAGSSSRRALTTALLDIASRGSIAFREESHLFGLHKKVGIATALPEPDPQTRARQLRNDARKLGLAERLIEDKVQALGRGSDGYIGPDDLLELGSSVGDFDRALETEVVQRGWFREKPSAVVGRWLVRAGLAVFGGVMAIGAGVALPSSGILLIGVAVLIAGVLIGILSRSMPAVSLPGAMIRAMLAAYRRTLRKTLEQARSMDQVVADAGLPWLETPDQVVVWGTALGLHEEIEQVLQRTLEDTREGRIAAGSAWLPAWYATGGGNGSGLFGDRSGFAGATAGSGGLLSSGAIPDLGGMMATLGTIGNSPSSSGGSGGGGGGGGFGGGGSGGGGGGSGGGF